ncbi:hypothetical protein SteCoe_9683 [Stentor coeruleus]|uniref:Uncharacterized protein n=1 Tax=Stentor coeruleus TaxID=5963 RepID=A0A1R2CH84_9CILI|nr:hypothetical protein SteCoe_9683 [Stentor coeruleus]
MAAYSFNSEPRVVTTRSEKFKPEDRMSMHLMYDKRVFRGHVHDIHNIRPVLSPQEQEELHLKNEREKNQEEMMKRQLEAFKKNKTKQSPYDIRPAATGRIEVDLQYFLTDQKDIKPNDSEVEAQTDAFIPKPPDPKFIPKKTGRDACTQIEDGDLFNFNIEVQPILNVLTNKTLEQALLEVEEESEMMAMNQFKVENKARKIEEEKAWAHMVKEEAERIHKKNLDVQAARSKYVITCNLLTKFKNLNIAKDFLAPLFPLVIEEFTDPTIQPDYILRILEDMYLPYIVEGTENYLEAKKTLNGIPNELCHNTLGQMVGKREKIVKQHKQKARKEQIRNINSSENKRFVRFLYMNPDFYLYSEFTVRIAYTLRGEELPENLSDSILLKDPEKKEGEEDSVVKEKPIEGKPDWCKYPTFLVDNIKRIGFAVANHPIQDTPKDHRKYGFLAEFYSESGDLLFTADSSCVDNYRGVKINPNSRDLTKKTSTDEILILTLNSLLPEVHNIFLYTYAVRPTPNEFKYAKYLLTDFETSQKIDSRNIKTEEFSTDDNGNIMPLYLAYRIYRQEKNPRNLKIVIINDNPVVEMPPDNQHWVLEIYNLPISKSVEDAKNMVQNLLKEGWKYSMQLTEGLINYRSMKMMQEIEYKKQVEENEQPGSKKKKKRPTKGKVIEEPVKMTEYIPPLPTYPSKTFGPIMIDICKDTVEGLYNNLAKNVDAELTSKWDQGMEICVKNKTIKKIAWVLKAHTMQDLTFDMKKTEEIPVLSIVDNDDEDD